MKKWIASLRERDWNRSILVFALALAAVFLTGSLHPEYSHSRDEKTPEFAAVEAMQPDVPLSGQGAWKRVAEKNPLLLFRCSVGDYR